MFSSKCDFSRTLLHFDLPIPARTTLNLLVQPFRHQVERSDSWAGQKVLNQTYSIISASLLQYTKIIGDVAFASLRYRSARSAVAKPLTSRR